MLAVQVKGSVLLEAMKHGASKVFSGAYAQYSHNVSAKISYKETKDDKFIYELDENSVMINNKKVEKDKDYYIVTNDFILIGGDGYKMLDYVKHPEKAKSVFEGGDILESYIKFGQLITNKEQKQSTNAFGNRKVDDYKEKNTKEHWSKSQPVIRNQKKQDILLFAYVILQSYRQIKQVKSVYGEWYDIPLMIYLIVRYYVFLISVNMLHSMMSLFTIYWL
nr:5'-nucleotidase C-terminal domain-containing protein [Mycoplasmopsis bovis]